MAANGSGSAWVPTLEAEGEAVEAATPASPSYSPQASPEAEWVAAGPVMPASPSYSPTIQERMRPSRPSVRGGKAGPTGTGEGTSPTGLFEGCSCRDNLAIARTGVYVVFWLDRGDHPESVTFLRSDGAT